MLFLATLQLVITVGPFTALPRFSAVGHLSSQQPSGAGEAERMWLPLGQKLDSGPGECWPWGRKEGEEIVSYAGTPVGGEGGVSVQASSSSFRSKAPPIWVQVQLPCLKTARAWPPALKLKHFDGHRD